ncbi:MAG: RND transporter, partial [Pseudolabrys sp.]
MSSFPPQDSFSEFTPRVVKPRNLALGIERIGFFALTHQAVVAIVFILLCIVAAVGLTRVKVDDSLSQLFRSDTDEFRTYEEVTRRFPSN